MVALNAGDQGVGSRRAPRGLWGAQRPGLGGCPINKDDGMSGADAADQFEEVASVAPLLERWLAETRAPRAPVALLDLIEEVRPDAETVGADLGAYSGAWARQIVDRYCCHMAAVDIAPSPLAAAERSKVRPVNADLQQLPFRTGSLSLVWCRDTFSMVPDVGAACCEIARVLRPGAGAVIYTAVTTPRLEPLERAELIAALTMPSWWTEGRRPIDDALTAAGLDVIRVDRRSPEHQESALLQADPELLHDLAVLGRFERESPAFEALTSSLWSARFRAWVAWPVYLLLGKLETIAWVVRKP